MTFDPNSASQIPVDPDLSSSASRDSLQQKVYARLRAQGMSHDEAMAKAARVTVRAQADQVKAERRASGESAREEAEVRTQIDDEVRGYPLPQVPADDAAATAEFTRRFPNERPPRDQRELDAFKRQLADEQQAQFETTMDEAGYGRRRAPGPRTPDGRRTQQGATFNSPQEAEEYHTRPPLPGPQVGRYSPSQYDLDMLARGYVPIYDEGGNVSYGVAAPPPTLPEGGDQNTLPQQPLGVRGAPGRYGERPDLERAGYDVTPVQGPLGQVYVYRARRSVDKNGNPSSVENPGLGGGAGDRSDLYRHDRMRARLESASGLESDQASAASLRDLRKAGARKRENDKAARQDLVTQRAQMQQNPLLYLSNKNVDPWSKMVMADQLLRRGFTGPTPLGVEAARNAQLTELGLRVAQGQGFQQMTPEQRAMVDLKMNEAERAMPAGERALKYKDSPDIHPSELDSVDAHVSENYSTPNSWVGAGGLSSSFDITEQQQTVDWLVSQGYTPQKAQKIVDQIVKRRNSQSWFGN